MAVSLKHTFVSAKADGPDTTLVQPSNWNAEHVLTMDTQRILGRATAGNGPAEEIGLGTNFRFTGGSLDLANSVSAAALTLSGNLTVDTTTLVVSASTNRVGVGTAAPVSVFHVSATVPMVTIDDGAGRTLRMRAPVSGAPVGFIGTQSTEPFAIYVGDAEQLRVTSAGNVGIGNTAPSEKLHVTGNALLTGTLRVEGQTIARGNGSAAAPSYAFDNDLDTGIFRSVSNQMGFSTGGAARMTLDNNGHLGVNTDAPAGRVHVVSGTEAGVISSSAVGVVPTDTTGPKFFGNTNSTTNNGAVVFESRANVSTASRFHFAFCNPNGVVGSISTSGSATAFNTSSDYRLKEDVVPLLGAAADIMRLRPVRFRWKADSESAPVKGFLAHEVQQVVPEAVTGKKDEVVPVGVHVDAQGQVIAVGVQEPEDLQPGERWTKTHDVPAYQGIDHSKLVPILTAALREALTQIAELTRRVNDLEARG